MSRLRNVLVFALAALGQLTAGATVFAQSDTTIVHVDIITDTPEKFKASGTLTGIDRSVPPNGVNPPSLEIPEIIGVNWTFVCYNLVWDWRIPPSPVDNGSHQTTVHLSGEHKHGPHTAGAVVDIDPNFLEEANSKEADAAFTAETPVTLTAMNHVPHPTSRSPHRDVYSIRHKVTAFQGPDHMVTGPMEIKAKHTGAATDTIITHDMVMGSSSGSGAHVSYDGGSNSLTIHMGVIDILNSTGLIAPGIEPEFVTDPLLNASIGDMVLPFLGSTLDGGHRFGGSATLLLDPEGELSLRGGFPEYRIYDTSNPGVLNSYALYDSMSTADAGACASPFLHAFADRNLMGQSIPEAVWFESLGICLVFVTSQNLAALTGGFTYSAYNVPATVVIAGAKSVAPVSGLPEGTEEHVAAPARNHPNPFLTRTTISYRVAQAGAVRIEIYDASGRLVRRLVDHSLQDAGEYSIDWDATSDDGQRVSSGVYFYRVTLGSRTYSNEMILVQ